MKKTRPSKHKKEDFHLKLKKRLRSAKHQILGFFAKKKQFENNEKSLSD